MLKSKSNSITCWISFVGSILRNSLARKSYDRDVQSIWQEHAILNQKSHTWYISSTSNNFLRFGISFWGLELIGNVLVYTVASISFLSLVMTRMKRIWQNDQRYEQRVRMIGKWQTRGDTRWLVNGVGIPDGCVSQGSLAQVCASESSQAQATGPCLRAWPGRSWWQWHWLGDCPSHCHESHHRDWWYYSKPRPQPGAWY